MSRTRAHDCRYDTPLTSEFVKLPSTAVCDDDDCWWQRHATDNTPEALETIRRLASHHAKMRKHPVTVHLQQEVHLTPRTEEHDE